MGRLREVNGGCSSVSSIRAVQVSGSPHDRPPKIRTAPPNHRPMASDGIRLGAGTGKRYLAGAPVDSHTPDAPCGGIQLAQRPPHPMIDDRAGTYLQITSVARIAKLSTLGFRM